MPLMLVKESGAGTNPAANSYADLADAASYHEATITGSAWANAGGTGAAGDAAKTAALVQATRTLDNLCEWPGRPVTLNQALGWPRVGAWIDGRELADSLVPVRVVFATAELARLLILNGDPTQESDDDGGTISSETIGPLKTDYRAPAGYGDKGAQLDEALPRSVMAILRPLLAGIGRAGSGTRFANVQRV